MNRALIALLLICAATQVRGAAPSITITVHADQPGATISPTMWGIFFEDINFGADGGLYPERIKNRSFEFTEPLTGWHQIMNTGAGRHRQPER